MVYRLLITILVLPALLSSYERTGLAQANILVRIEETDPSISYSDDWYENSGEANSQSHAALTNARGALAVLTFTGTGITWIGVTDASCGLATIFLDGTMYTVDTYSELTHYQRPIFSARGLAPGSHTLSIEITHDRGPNAEGSWVWIDAFDIENGTAILGGTAAMAGRAEQDNPALIYTGTWFRRENEAHSGSSAALAVDAASSATIGFNGTAIQWIGYRDEWSGIARLLLDGTFVAVVDTYASSSQSNSVVYAISDLPPGNHTLTIEVTGTHNPVSAGSWIWIDAFDVLGGDKSTRRRTR